ncbi:hypothetical protein [Mesorhizobium sp. M0676]
MNQNQALRTRPSTRAFTENQGQYLAVIYAYSHMFRRRPAEAT